MKNLNEIMYRVALIVLSAFALGTAARAQEIEWERLYSQEQPLPLSEGYYSGRHILPMADGGYVVTSITGGSTAAVTRLDGVGNRMWERVITDTQSNIYGEFGRDEPVKLYPRFSYLREDGRVVLFGNEGGVPDAFVNYGSVYQLVLNEETGKPLDTISGFADSVGVLENGSPVCRRHNGGFLEAGIWQYGDVDSLGRVFLQAITPGGRPEGWWQMLAVGDGNGQSVYHYPGRVIQTPDGGFAIFGARRVVGGNTFFLLKVDSLGNKMWERQTEPENSGTATGSFFDTTADGGFILVGMVTYFDTTQQRKRWRTLRLVKCSPEGEIEWDREYTSDRDYTTPRCVRQTADGGFVILSTIGDFNENYTVYLASQEDGFLLKTDGEGKEQWRKRWGGANREDLWDMVLLPDNSIVVTGSGTRDPVWNGLYLAKIKIGTLGVGETGEEAIGTGTFQVIPNPARDRLRVIYHSSGVRKELRVRLYDLLGRDVLGRSVAVGSSGSIELDIAELAAGAYRAVLERKDGSMIGSQPVMILR